VQRACERGATLSGLAYAAKNWRMRASSRRMAATSSSLTPRREVSSAAR
jgi:hypothetical protein